MSNIRTIKSMLNILDIAVKVVNLRKVGKSYRGCCPFHGERTPSFFIYPQTNTYKCFGCGAYGSVLDLYAFERGISIKNAVEELEQAFGLDTSFNPISLPISNEEIEMLHLIPSRIRLLYIDDPETFAYIVGERIKTYLETWESMERSLEVTEFKEIATKRVNLLRSMLERLGLTEMDVKQGDFALKTCI